MIVWKNQKQKLNYIEKEPIERLNLMVEMQQLKEKKKEDFNWDNQFLYDRWMLVIFKLCNECNMVRVKCNINRWIFYMKTIYLIN